MSRELTYPERISMFVAMLKRASDLKAFERRFDDELKNNETFRPVAKQCRLAIKLWKVSQ